MTDNEITKALDICSHLEACADCPFGSLEGTDKCMHTLLLNALDLINRQKAEIERLKSLDMQIEVSEKIEKEIKSEAIKEFAKRLRKDACRPYVVQVVTGESIDDLVKEMVGEQECH